MPFQYEHNNVLYSKVWYKNSVIAKFKYFAVLLVNYGISKTIFLEMI